MPLSVREKADLALWRFEGLARDGQPTPWTAVTKRFRATHGRGIAERTAQEAVSEAFQARWVEVVEGLVFPPYVQVDTIASALKAEWLTHTGTEVRVLRSQEPVSELEAHAQVGALLGRAFSGIGRELSAGAFLGVCSGRALHFFHRALQREPRIAARNLSVVSLSGSLFVQKSGGLIESKEAIAPGSISLDADAHAINIAAQFCEGPIYTYPIHSSIAAATDADRNAALLRAEGLQHMLAADAAQRVCVTGIGNFRRGHRLYDAVTPSQAAPDERAVPRTRDPREAESIIRPVQAELDALADKVDEIVREYRVLFPVADLANRLFVTGVPSEVAWREVDGEAFPVYGRKPRAGCRRKSITPEHQAMIAGPDVPTGDPEQMTIGQLVNRINARLVTVTKTQLSATHLLVVAATWKKARAIRHLCQRFPGMIRLLAIDEPLATELLNLTRYEG